MILGTHCSPLQGPASSRIYADEKPRTLSLISFRVNQFILVTAGLLNSLFQQTYEHINAMTLYLKKMAESMTESWCDFFL